MALEYKRRGKQNLDKVRAQIEDRSPNSENYFNITEIPPYLGPGKNSIRLKVSNKDTLAPKSQIRIEVKDSNGNPIYHEVPNLKSSDGSILITIWVYTDRENSKENTASGPATITIVGLARATVGSGSGVGSGRGSGRGRGITNEKVVKWTKTIPVRIDTKSSSKIVFQKPNLPTGTVSSSLVPFKTFSRVVAGNDPLGLGVGSGTGTGPVNTELVSLLPLTWSQNITDNTPSTDEFKSVQGNGATGPGAQNANGGFRRINFGESAGILGPLLNVSKSINNSDDAQYLLRIQHSTGASKFKEYKIDSVTQTFNGSGTYTFKVDLTSFHSGSISPYGAFIGGAVTPVTIKRKATPGLVKTKDVINTKYIASNFGSDSRLQRNTGDSLSFNGEMVDGEARLDLSNVRLYPEQRGVTQPTSHTASILNVTGSDIIQLDTKISGSNNHTFKYSDDFTIPTTIVYFSSASRGDSENLSTKGTITLPSIKPISGEVNEVRTSVKSKGLDTDFEVLGNNTVTTDTNFSYSITIPSKHIGDPKTLKIEFVNVLGEVSEQFVLIEDVVFPGSNTFIGGKGSLISGSIFISNALGSGIELGGASSGFIKSVGFEGQTSASLGKGPGGFIFYSGSGNLTLGVDNLDGVGLQLIGDNDDRHFIFTTDNGGLLDVKTDKFFIGTTGSQFISGANQNIEISSSLFHLDPQNESLVIGADATILAGLTVNSLRTPATVNGAPATKTNSSSSIDADGFARFVSASIAGFTVNTEEIKSSDNALRLKAAGDITASRVLLSGGTITDGVTILGSVTANSIRTPATIAGNPSTETNSSSSIRPDGFARFVSASIGGWDITTNSIEGGNLIMKPSGVLQTKDYASNNKGWIISSENNGFAEFENVKIRGTLSTTTFEKESVNAVGGQLWVANSTAITGSAIIASDTTMSVVNASGFAQDEILLIKKVTDTGFNTEYVKIESASIDGDGSNPDNVAGRIYVERGYTGGDTPSNQFVGDTGSSATDYEEGQVIVSTGKIGTGYIRMNANPNDQSTPYMDIIERTGSGTYDVKLKARLGDLSGLANSSYVFGNSNPGFGLATDNVFLQGGIIAKTGSIGGINMEAGKLYIGTGTHGNSNTGFYVDSGSFFSLGDRFVWNPTTSALTIRGTLQFPSGDDVQQAINDATASNTAKALSITTDSQVFAFDNSVDTTATPNVINFTVSQQNLNATVGTSDITITKAGGSTISTPSLGGVVSEGSGQQSGSISFSGLSLAKTDLPITIEVSKDSLNDSTTLFKVQGGDTGSDGQDGAAGAAGADGTDAVSAFLTNESHTLALSSSNEIISFAGAQTDMVVFEGVTDSTSNYTVAVSSSTDSHITTSTSGNTVTITNTTTPFSGSIIITATSASIVLPKTMSLSVARQGDDGEDGAAGTPGSNALSLSLTTDSQVFSFPSASSSTADDDTIEIVISQQNLSGTIAAGNVTITDSSGTTLTTPTFAPTTLPNNTGQVSGSITFSSTVSGDKTKLPLTIRVAKGTLSDETKIFKVEGGTGGADGAAGTPGSDGSDAVTTFLTNESHTLAAAFDGTVATFTGAETDMVVFEGVTDSTSNYGYSGTGSAGVTFSKSSNTFSITGMSHDSGSLTITAVSSSTQLVKTMSLSKSKQGNVGQDGTNAKLLNIISDSQTFAFDDSSDSSATPTSVNFTVNQQNLSGTVGTSDITITKAGGSTFTTPSLGGSVSNGTGTRTFALAFSSFSKSDLPLTIAVSKDSLSDSVKVFKIEGGADGAAGSPGSPGAAGSDGVSALTAFLTNDSHTLPLSGSGNIISFAGANTDILVFQGVTDVTDDFIISTTSDSHITTTLSGDTVTVTNSTTPFSGSVVVTATSASVVLNKTMSVAVALQGDDGTDGTNGTPGTPGTPGATGPTGPAGPTGSPGADNQDFSFANENLEGVGPAPAGLLMTANVFGYHGGIQGENATLTDFTSYLDSDGNFFLGSGSNSFLNWDNTDARLLITGSQADIRVDKFVLGNLNSQYISGSNSRIEISSSKIHVKPNGDIVVGKISATEGSIGGFIIGTGSIVNDAGSGAGKGLLLDADEKRITLNDTTFGNTGLQFESNNFNPRMFIGRLKTERSASFIRFEDSQLEISASTFHLSSSGELAMEADITANQATLRGLKISGTILRASGSKGDKSRKLIETWATGSALGDVYASGVGSGPREKALGDPTIGVGSVRDNKKRYSISNNYTVSTFGDTLTFTPASSAGAGTGYGALSSGNLVWYTTRGSNVPSTQWLQNYTMSMAHDKLSFIRTMKGDRMAGSTGFHADDTNEWAQRIPSWTDVDGDFRDYEARRPDGEVGFNGNFSFNTAGTPLLATVKQFGQFHSYAFKTGSAGSNQGESFFPKFNIGLPLQHSTYWNGYSYPNYNSDTLYLGLRSERINIDKEFFQEGDNLTLQFAGGVVGNWGGGDFTLETHIYDANDGTRLKKYAQEVVSGGKQWNVNLPISGMLFRATNLPSGYKIDTPIFSFFVELRWYKSGNVAGAGGGGPSAIRLTEMRFVKGANITSATFGSLEVGKAAISPIENEGGGSQLDGTHHALEIHGHWFPGDDDTFDLGWDGSHSQAARRWDDIYATNGTVQTSDSRSKTEITGSVLGLDFMESLRPVSFKQLDKDGNPKTRTHYGLISQEVSSSLAVAGLTSTEFAGLVTGSWDPTGTINTRGGTWGLRYTEFISPMIKAIQELSAEVKQLKLQISGSNG